MTAIVDYGVGNLFSLKSSLSYIGEDVIVTSDSEKLRNADRIILPGVGAFGDAAQKLIESGLADLLLELADSGMPILGICLGMQLLFEKSFEYGEHKGLGLVKGSVKPIQERVSNDYKIPHIGWNALTIRKPVSPIFKYIKDGDCVYFVHSFYGADCDDSLIATVEYGFDVTAAVQNGNVFGTQFHPEKSGEVGMKILRAFCEI